MNPTDEELYAWWDTLDNDERYLMGVTNDEDLRSWWDSLTDEEKALTGVGVSNF